MFRTACLLMLIVAITRASCDTDIRRIFDAASEHLKSIVGKKYAAKSVASTFCYGRQSINEIDCGSQSEGMQSAIAVLCPAFLPSE